MQIFQRLPSPIDIVLREINIFKSETDIRPHLINVRLYLACVYLNPTCLYRLSMHTHKPT